jgi:hypothetical protein
MRCESATEEIHRACENHGKDEKPYMEGDLRIAFREMGRERQHVFGQRPQMLRRRDILAVRIRQMRGWLITG